MSRLRRIAGRAARTAALAVHAAPARRAAVGLSTAAALAAAAAPASAATWTEIPSGTSAEITAIEYQGADRFWFTTSDGSIYRRAADGSFTLVRAASGLRLNDIEFRPGSNLGFAVGNGGQVLRSTDGGTIWTAVTGIPVSRKGTTFPDCTATEPLGDVNSVRFAGATGIWLFAEGSQLAKSYAGDGDTGTWEDANRDTKGTASATDDTCRIRGDIYGDGHADGFFANDQVGYIVSASFAYVYFTADALANDATRKPADAGNAGSNRRELVGDPGNPSRMWSVAPEPYGLSTTGYTDDGYGTQNRWTIVNDQLREFPANGPYAVDFSGGTVLAAGDAGLVLNSTDGRNFYYAGASGALATQNWRAAALASATAGAIGGVGGKLAVSSDANVAPDVTPPTGTISGPATGRPGQALTFTAQVADEPGGSGVNAGSLSWTSAGLPTGAGGSATFTFPSAGTYTVTLSFADNAGNRATANTFVTVSGTAALPKPTLAGASKPPVAGKVARKKGRFVVLKVRGRLGIPAGVTKAAACRGTISLSVYKGKKRIGSKKVKVSKSCRYVKTVKVRRKRVGKAKRIKLKVAFKGNAVLAPLSSTYSIKVR